MMVATLLLMTSMAQSAEGARDLPEPSSRGPAPSPSAAAASPAAADVGGEPSAPPRRLGPRRSTSLDDEALPPGGGRIERAGLDTVRPRVLQPRSPAAALVLGMVVGFGTGSYYAGEPRQGVVFSAVDGVLALGLAGLTIALNQEVVKNDFATGHSLQRDERSMTGKEKSLYAASWVTGGLWAASHAVQAVVALRSARRTNRLLDQFSFVPLAGGGGARFELAL